MVDFGREYFPDFLEVGLCYKEVCNFFLYFFEEEGGGSEHEGELEFEVKVDVHLALDSRLNDASFVDRDVHVALLRLSELAGVQ